MSNLELPDVYAILDFQTCLERNLDPRSLVKSWCDAGIELIQVRAKKLSDLNYWVFAETVQDCCVGYDTKLIINTRADIAFGLEAAGVHLPVNGVPIDAVKCTYPEMLIFASCHNIEEIEARKSADAITLSPLFSPKSKPDDLRVTIGITSFQKMAESFPGKTYALGGIDEKNLSNLKGISIASLGYLCQPNAYENAKSLIFRDNS